MSPKTHSNPALDLVLQRTMQAKELGMSAFPTLEQLPADEDILVSYIRDCYKVEGVVAVTLGRLLLKWKQLTNYGDWTALVQQNLPFTVETAARYMRLGNPDTPFIASLLADQQINSHVAFLMLRVQAAGSDAKRGPKDDDNRLAQEEAAKIFWSSEHLVGWVPGGGQRKLPKDMTQRELQEAIRTWNSTSAVRRSVIEDGIPFRAVQVIESTVRDSQQQFKARLALKYAIENHAEPVSTASMIARVITDIPDIEVQDAMLERIQTRTLNLPELGAAIAAAKAASPVAIHTNQESDLVSQTTRAIEAVITTLALERDLIRSRRVLPGGVTAADGVSAARQIVQRILDRPQFNRPEITIQQGQTAVLNR